MPIDHTVIHIAIRYVFTSLLVQLVLLALQHRPHQQGQVGVQAGGPCEAERGEHRGDGGGDIHDGRGPYAGGRGRGPALTPVPPGSRGPTAAAGRTGLAQNTMTSTARPARIAPAVVSVSRRTRKCCVMASTSRNRRCNGDARRRWHRHRRPGGRPSPRPPPAPSPRRPPRGSSRAATG